MNNNNNGVLFPGGVLVTSNSSELGSVTGRPRLLVRPGAAVRQGRLCLQGRRQCHRRRLAVRLHHLGQHPRRLHGRCGPRIPCSPRNGPPRLNTSITISAAPPSWPPGRHRRRSFQRRRAHCEGWPELSLQLGWPGCRPLLIVSDLKLRKGRPRAGLFVFGCAKIAQIRQFAYCRNRPGFSAGAAPPVRLSPRETICDRCRCIRKQSRFSPRSRRCGTPGKITPAPTRWSR